MRLFACCLLCYPALAADYQHRVDEVRRTPGFVALWDFVKRDGGRFAAHQATGDRHDYRLDAVNYVLDQWNQGRPASYDDFPLLGSGPFGQAVRFNAETDPNFRPCLLVPRERLHGSGLDVKGPGQSVSMVVWLIRESGNHAIAGIWHEGTDKQHGARQYALFAGLAANNGAVAAHVSENGGASFGDRYARNLASTPEVIPEKAWSAVGFVFDNAKNTVTAYLDGKASAFWIENPKEHPFFKWPYRGWVEGSYKPPEEFTKVRVVFDANKIASRELIALSANPFWFPHDLYTPPTVADGGPFTIGRVIHNSRNVGFTGWIGGVAVFNRALSSKEMRRLAAVARTPLPWQSPSRSSE